MTLQTPILKKALVFDPILSEKTLICSYEIDGQILTNTYEFPEGINKDKLGDETTRKISQWMAIASSFGLFSLGYLNEIVCQFPLTKHDVTFFEKLFYLGFGEFKLTNTIPLKTTTALSSTQEIVETENETSVPSSNKSEKALLLNGGGKDGSVSAYLLTQNNVNFTWFQRGNSVAQQQVVGVWDKPLLKVNRILDPNRKKGVYAGHRPMSAGIAFLAMLSAYLFDYGYVIASNESSANEGNITVDGFTVNHQYSKSLEFEMDLQNLFSNTGIADVRYFSLLRPLNELQIASFTKGLSNDQLAAIVSCNNGTSTGTWCLACAKCAFISLVIYAVDPKIAQSIWGDVNTINTPSLAPYLSELLDPEQEKPLECVGTLDECHLAANLIIQNDSKDQFLNENTANLLKRFIPENTATGIPSTIGQHRIPEAFQPIIGYIQQSL